MWNGNEATSMKNQLFLAQRRTNRAVLKVDGPEARHFLHNLLTADIEGLRPGEARYAALLTPQGKILFDFFVFDAGGYFLMDHARSQRAELVKRLTLYKLRAKIGIAAADDHEVGVTPAEPAQAMRFADPRDGRMGWRVIAPAGTFGNETEGYEVARIRAGLADSDADIGSGVLFPHEANLDQLRAVSFEKGCYVGQEVVSRMEHRGIARSRILPVRLSGPAPAKGAEIRSGGKVVGSLLSSAGSDALALIRLDRLAEATAPLLTEAISVTVLKPSWVRYDVPGARGVD